jgi:hypothetical protein
MVGAMLTEFMRRTLRNGVIKIDEEMHSYVAEKVDATITDRTPLLEKTAAEVAEITARAAAADLVSGEVQGLEHRTEAKARELASQIEETEKRVQSQTEQTAQRLSGQLELAEKQAAEKAQELTEQVQDLWTRSRRGVAHFKGQLKTLEAAVLQLDHGIKQEKSERQSVQATVQADFESLKQGQARLAEEVQQLRQANEGLAARVAELERPRGIRALFGRVFRRGQATGPAEAETDTERPS